MYWFPFLHKNGIYVVVLLLLLFVCILSSQTDNYVHSMLALTPFFYDFFAIKSQICAALTESSQATNIGPGSTSLAWASRISLLPDILLTNASINWSLDELVWQSCGPTSARFDVTLNFTFLMTHQLSLGDLESQEDDMFSQSVLMDLNKYSTSTPSSSSTFSSHSLPLADDPNLFDRMMQTHPLFVRVGQLLFSPASGKAPLHSFSSYSVPIVTDVYSGNDQEITQTAILTSECRQFPDEFDWSDDGTTLYTHIAIELQECWSSFCNPSSSRPAFLLRLSFPLHSNQTVADLIRDSAPPSDTHDQWLDRLPIALKHESERFSATTKQEQEIIQKEPLYTEWWAWVDNGDGTRSLQSPWWQTEGREREGVEVYICSKVGFSRHKTLGMTPPPDNRCIDSNGFRTDRQWSLYSNHTGLPVRIVDVRRIVGVTTTSKHTNWSCLRRMIPGVSQCLVTIRYQNRTIETMLMTDEQYRTRLQYVQEQATALQQRMQFARQSVNLKNKKNKKEI